MEEEGEEASDSVEALREKVVLLEDREKKLLDDQQQLEADFGLRRAKLKDLYMQKEEELRLRSEATSCVEAELDLLRTQNQQLNQELEEARSNVTIAQCTAENDIEIERRKCQEEIATLQQLMKEEVANAVGKTGSRYEGEIKRLKKLTERLETEKQSYRKLYDKQIEETDLRAKGESLLNPGVLSAVTKSLAKRVSLNPASAIATSEKQPILPTSGVTVSTGSSSIDLENLEDSMRRAQEDAAVLRSLVEPLEEEITALKEKLREQDAQLRAHEAQEAAQLHTADVVTSFLQGKDVAEAVQELDDKLKGLSCTLEAEKSSRADLELYTAILNTQKTALTDEVDRLRTLLTQLRQTYETERREHRELKHTWQRANDQFLEAQRLYLADTRRMQSVLTGEQLKRLQELQVNEEHQEQFSLLEVKSLTSLSATPSPAIRRRRNSVDHPDADSLRDDVSLIDVADGDDDDQSVLSDLEAGSQDVLASRYSPEKMPRLTQDQQLALTDVTLNTEITLPETPDDDSGDRRVVSEAEWAMLHDEITRARQRLSQSCPTCTTTQESLSKALSEHRETEKKRVVLEQALDRYKEDLDREAKYRQTMNEKWKKMAEEYEIKANVVTSSVEATGARYKEVIGRVRATVAHLQEQLRLLTEQREAAQTELTRLQEENDNLVGKHSQHSQELQNEIINLPDNMEEMQLLLLRYREDIIASKVAKEHMEESLKSKILFLKDQVLAEQHEKNTIEDRLSLEVDQLREKVALLESMEVQVEGERKVRAESEGKLRDVESKQAEAQLKSQQLLTALKAQVAEQTQNRARLEAMVVELKGRVATLQHDLDTSEAVQRDFVRLSQSLQVQLEKIRQSDKEVRWQHEEDVEDCSGCRQRFSVGRRKHHCRHCGKIFCHECLAKMVVSGPNSRPSKVCDVCHTLLVQDATPYFSTEVPHSPD